MFVLLSLVLSQDFKENRADLFLKRFILTKKIHTRLVMITVIK